MNNTATSGFEKTTLDELLSGAVPSTAEAELYAKLDQQQGLIDEIQQRRQSDWGVLANQVVGSEKVSDS